MLKKLFAVLFAAAVVFGAGRLYFQSRDPGTAASEYMTPSDRMMTIAGANVRVRIEGPADAPPLILLHGFIYSLETWDAWAEALKADYRVIRFDLLGHGLSGPDPKKRYSPQERADFLVDVMNALGIERAVVGGNSLGGLAAWRFAAANPSRVSALVLVSPGAYPTNGVGDTPLSPPAPMALFLRTAPDVGVAATLGNIYFDKSYVTPEKIALVRDMMRQPGNGDAYVQSIEEFSLPDPEPLLSSISAPTLILWGKQDAVIPVGHGERMTAVIPNSELISYENVGHVAQEEAANQTIADVKAFLTSIEAKG